MRKIITTKITTWGNSFGLRLPKDFVYASNISLDKPLEIYLGAGRSILVREAKNIKNRLSKGYFVKVFKKAKPVVIGEYDWGGSKGKEIW